MNQFLNKLNLSSVERRLVVGSGYVVFIVINLWFIWPHFGDWNITKIELQKARETLERFQKETDVAHVADLKAKLAKLEGQGSPVAPNEQSLDLIRSIQNQAMASGVSIQSSKPANVSSNVKTNEFFDEKGQNLHIVTGEKELVDFLVSLSSANSMIRALSMTLRPEPSPTPTKLQGEITLVASYQRNRPKPAPVPAPVPVQAPKSAVKNTATNATASASASVKPDAKKNEMPARTNVFKGPPPQPGAKPANTLQPIKKP